MKTKQEIVENWLPRYTGVKLEDFGKYILLTNFDNYVKKFAEWNNVEVGKQDIPLKVFEFYTRISWKPVFNYFLFCFHTSLFSYF